MARNHKATGATMPGHLALAFLVLLVLRTGFTHAKIDAETGGECLDSDPANCPFWAATGECQSNRGYMHVHCKKSCDRCNVVRVNSRSDINRFMAEKQKEIEEKRRVRKHEKEALEALKGGTLELGSDSVSGSSGSSGGAKELSQETKEQRSGDEKGSAAATGTTTQSVTIDSNGNILPSNEDTKTAAATAATTATSDAEKPKPKQKITQPKKKKAKIDAETGLECVDLDANCPFMAMTGDCKTNRAYMSRNCRLSCDRCHIVRVNNQAEMHNFIKQKQKETEKQRAARKQAREVEKILSNGELPPGWKAK